MKYIHSNIIIKSQCEVHGEGGVSIPMYKMDRAFGETGSAPVSLFFPLT